jgi:hypothetical protein
MIRSTGVAAAIAETVLCAIGRRRGVFFLFGMAGMVGLLECDA